MNRIQNRADVCHAARGIAILAVIASGLFQPGRAEAQWGFGGYGFWGYNPENSQRTVDAINQRAAIAAQAAYASRQDTPSTRSENSYTNHLRDGTYEDRVAISTRRGVPSQVAPRPAPTRAASGAAPSRAATPVVPLSGFFSPADVLIWPADSPLSGGLDAKRAASDAASLEVYKQVKSGAVASVSSVSEARQLLLDYGRPALQYIRDSSTTQVADSFHLFLLSLYEALAQAGNPPAPRR